MRRVENKTLDLIFGMMIAAISDFKIKRGQINEGLRTN